MNNFLIYFIFILDVGANLTGMMNNIFRQINSYLDCYL